MQFEAVKVALKQDATGYVLTMKIHPDEIPEELMRDFVGARYGVAMARISDDETQVMYNNRVKIAGIMCKDKRFHEWLAIDGNQYSESSATEWLHRACDMRSRTELNGNLKAQKLFDAIVKEFEEWRSQYEPF